jgi:hypothetical protein
MKAIPGDPLTGSLPRTHLVIPRPILGPTRPARAEWPAIADPQAVTMTNLTVGRIAYIRTRFGIRKQQIRYVARSLEPGKHRGRHYLVAMDRRGLCHAHWVDRVIRTETTALALPPHT